jgi:hypothetical protein
MSRLWLEDARKLHTIDGLLDRRVYLEVCTER